MVYDHAVKAYGRFYPAGADVPEKSLETPQETPETPQDASEEDAVSVSGKPTETSATKRRTTKREQSE